MRAFQWDLFHDTRDRNPIEQKLINHRMLSATQHPRIIRAELFDQTRLNFDNLLHAVF